MGLAKPNRDGGRDERPARASKAKGGRGTGAAGTNGAAAAKVNGSLRFEFPSDFDTGCDVQRQILAEVERHGFNPNSLFATRLALEEAMVNAIKHGNKLDPAKKVVVEA